jgi:mono/diheme cytochrome c family protein
MLRVKVTGIATLVVAALATTIALPVMARDRAEADIVCEPSEAKLNYDCAIKLTKRNDGQPIDGAEVTIFADMPSMPMAHNVPPVIAKAAPEAGLYLARLHLEMRGEWALRLRITGAVRDIIVKRLEFGGKAGQARHSAFEGFRKRYAGYADQNDEALVQRGKVIFDEFCGVCHGSKLQGELKSGATVLEGQTPAPPLNGTAHSHHHADGELFGVVKHGPGSSLAARRQRMPDFDRVLPDADIWAVIAYIKSLWPKRVQRRHAKRFPPR